MGIKFFFSDRYGDLAKDMFRRILDRDDDILDPIEIVISNKNVQLWLQMEMARENGVSMNLDFKFIEKFLWNSLKNEIEKTDENGRSFQYLDKETLENIVFFILMNEYENNPEDDDLEPFFNYIGKDMMNSPIFGKKVWQLSRKLAYLFLEYGNQRSEILEDWRQNKTICNENSELKRIEQAEKAVFLKIFGRDGFLSKKDNYRQIPLFELLNYSFERSPRPATGEIYLFGFSHISVSHLRALMEIGKERNLVCYFHSPSFFKTDKDNSPAQFDVSQIAKIIEKNDIIRLWGKPGFDILKLLEKHRGKETIEINCIEKDGKNQNSKSVLSNLHWCSVNFLRSQGYGFC